MNSEKTQGIKKKKKAKLICTSNINNEQSEKEILKIPFMIIF